MAPNFALLSTPTHALLRTEVQRKNRRFACNSAFYSASLQDSRMCRGARTPARPIPPSRKW